MTSQQLQYLLAVSEQKSLSKAAQTLYLSQPALTQSIAKLEQEIGTPLFVREPHGMTLTDAGVIVVNSARNMLYFEQQMRERIASLRAPNKRELSILVQRPYLKTIETLLHMITQDRYPDLRVNILGGFSEQAEQALSAGSVDMAIYNTRKLPGKSFSYRILGAQEMMLAFSPSLPAAGALLSGVPWQTCLKGYPFVLHDAHTPARALEDEVLEKSGYTPDEILCAENETVHHNALSDKRYIGFLPSTSSDMGLLRIPMDPPIRFYCLTAWPKDQTLPEELLYLLDVLSLKLA